MKNRKLLLIVSLVLAMTMSLGGTLAYLTDTDSDVNVMTLGNVKIEQHEFERRDEDGTEGYDIINTVRGDSYKLYPFSQAKPLLPTTCENPALLNWDETDVYFAQLADGEVNEGDMHYYGLMNVFPAELTNVQDKFVFVENTGNTDAYVRTIIALEAGSCTVEEWDSLIKTSSNGFWTYKFLEDTVKIDDNNYVIMVCNYTGSGVSGNNGRHPDGIVHPGDYTYNNLAQVYMTSKATNEDVEALDGNKNGTYDILVVSQAVQASGFTNPVTALNTAFGEVSANSHPWIDMDDPDNDNDQEPDGVVIPTVVSTADELEAALANGGEVNLTADIAIPEGEQILVPAGSTATLNLNGYTVTSTSQGYGIRNEGNVTITNGTIEGQFGAIGNYGDAVCVVENATLISKGYPENSSHAIYTSGNSSLTLTNVTVNHEGAGADGSVLYAAGSSTVVINSGNFTWSGSAYTLAAAGTSNVTINGGTFQNDNFFNWGGTITDNRTTE